ncbi:hypothetical protein [Arthrobacter roseus]|uniref:hypothetical protein n=1 Tax=Arthrobacter roseus TaxID=136274 RepID=UPI001963B2D7|nr:hypothetical protein [Arthrobacter roseus]MBM7847459.1 hypothetical protein [Arthrobacter roseus]
MSKTIEGVPEFFTREQYISFFTAVGVDPAQTMALKFLPDSVEILAKARNSDGAYLLADDPACICSVDGTDDDCTAQHGFAKHTIIIPVREK